MPALHQVHANQLLAGSLAQAAFVASTAPIRCRLMTANGSATANGTELASSGGYTAGASAPSVTFGAPASGSAASTTAVTVTNMPAATIVGVELWDSTATPARKWYGALTASKTTNAGDTFSIAIGSLTATLS